MQQEQQVIVVSGGSRGLGRALVEDLLERGHTVATFSRSQTPFITWCRERDPDSAGFYWEAIDATDLERVQAFARTVIRRYGKVDVLINNAGVVVENILTLLSSIEIDRQLQINLASPIYLTQSCLKSMLQQRRGCIINISSVNGLRGNAGISVYSATKGALDGLTRSLAREMGSIGIRVNSVAPGYFASDGARELLTDKQIGQIVRRTPLGRLGAMQDMLGLIRFLMSPEAGFITGQTIAVDGGLSC
jgi:3-oxoacyl-[acyl-carrier protein] reductase